MIPNTISPLRLSYSILLLILILTPLIKAQSETAEDYLKQGIAFRQKYNNTTGELQQQMIDSCCYYFGRARELYKASGQLTEYVNVSMRLAHANSLTDNSTAIDILNETISVIESETSEIPDYLESVFDLLGRLYKNENMNSEAFMEFDKLLKFRINKYGMQNNKVATLCYQIGQLYLQEGLYQEAARAFRTYLSIKKFRLPEQPVAYKYLAECAKGSGDYESCTAYLDTAVTIADRVYDNPNNDLYLQFGIIYTEAGEYKKAKQAIEKAGSLQNSSDKRASKYIPVCRSLGEILLAEGDYTTALMYLNKAEELINKSSIKSTVAEKQCCLIRIELLILMEDYNGALAYLNKYKVLTENTHSDDVSFLNLYSLMGTVKFYQKNYDESLSYFKKVLLFYTGSNNRISSRLNKIYRLIGEIYTARGEYGTALKYLKKSLDDNVNLYGSRSPYTAENYVSLSKFYIAQQEYDKALDAVNEACSALRLDLSSVSEKSLRDGNDKKILLEALTCNNIILESLSRRRKNSLYQKELQSAYITTSVLIENLKKELSADESKYYWTRKSYSFFEKAIVTMIEYYYNTSDTSFLETALYLTEKSKSNLMMNSLSVKRNKELKGIPDSLARYETELLEKISLLKRLRSNESEKILADSARLANWEKKLLNLELDYDRFKRELAKAYPELNPVHTQLPHLSINTIQQKLKEHEMLINYFLGNESLVLFSITKDKYSATAIHDSTLRTDLKTYYDLLQKRAGLGRNKNKELFLKLSNDLFNRLLSHAIHSEDGIEKLIIIPSDQLTKIPFETLITSQKETYDFPDQDYLIKNYEVIYYCCADLYFQEYLKKYKKEFIGFAPSDISSSEGGNMILPELFNAPEEVKDIQEFFTLNERLSEIYTGRQASEEKFKSIISDSCKILHIATHSFSDSTNPDQSGIYLCHEQNSGQDGILYADEIYNSNINSDLIVLSSCEGGLGKYIQGEGMLSLARAFISAGVPNIIFSLWDVSDRNTYNLMVEFYRNIIQGKTYSAALRNAKLLMLGDEFTSSPDSWGPFIMFGSQTLTD